MDVDTDGDGDCVDAGGSKRYFYCQDANYNVVALRQGSNIVERYEYDPYGNVRIFKGYDAAAGHEHLTVVSDSIAGNPFLFAGYFYDNETGLYHVRHRMYSPTLQRWLQRDPLFLLRLDRRPEPPNHLLPPTLSHSVRLDYQAEWLPCGRRCGGMPQLLNHRVNLSAYAGAAPIQATDPMGLKRIEITPELCVEWYHEMELECRRALVQCVAPLVPPVTLEAVVGAIIAGAGAVVEGAVCGAAGLPFVLYHLGECWEDFSNCRDNAQFIYDACMEVATENWPM